MSIVKKHANFSIEFINEVNDYAYKNGLISSQTYKQKQEGTLSFYDPETDSKYTLHENGYIRRYCKNLYPYGLSKPMWSGYQLNDTKIIDVKYLYHEGTYKATKRIMASPEEQLTILKRRVKHFRKYINNES